jgi:hypothetical protein
MPDAALELERNRSKRHHRATQPQEYSSDDEDRLPPNIHEHIATFHCAEPTVQVNDDQYSELGHWQEGFVEAPPLSSPRSQRSMDVSQSDEAQTHNMRNAYYQNAYNSYNSDGADSVTNHFQSTYLNSDNSADDSSADDSDDDSVHGDDVPQRVTTDDVPLPVTSEEDADIHQNLNEEREREFQRYLKSVRECAQEDSLTKEGLIRQFFRIHAQSSNSTEAAAKSYWNLFRLFLPHLKLPSYLTVRNKLERGVPMPTTEYMFKNLETKEEFVVANKTSFPRKQYGDTTKYQVLEQYARTPLMKMFNLFLASHFDNDPDIKNRDHKVTFSLDGVPIDKSSGRAMDIASVQFDGCKIVYPIAINIYVQGRRKMVSKDLDTFVDELLAIPQLTLKQVVADAPCRAYMKNIKQHSGHYSCESCYERGNVIVRTVRWPASTMNSPTLKCNETVRTLALQMDNNEFSKEEIADGHNFGVKGSSPLMRLPTFDCIYQCQPDPMHMLMLGCGKHMIMRILQFRSKDVNKIINAKNTRNRISTSKKVQAMLHAMNRFLMVTKMISEIPRQTRSIWHLLRYKASEWRSLIMILFVIITDGLIEGGYQPHARVWSKYVYICRLTMLPDQLYHKWLQSDLAALHKDFYGDFEKTFGTKGCTFNIHAFSHMQQYRNKNLMSDVTTEPFEDMYRFVAGMYQSGTCSIANQICRGMMFLRTQKHECRKKVTIELREDNQRRTSQKLQDDLFYSLDERFYRILQKLDNNGIICREIITQDYVQISRLNWTKVGVRIYKHESAVNVTLDMSDFMCKAVICKNLIVAVFSEILLC